MTERRLMAAPVPPAFPEEFLEHMGFIVNKVAEQLNGQVELVIAPHRLTVAQYGLLLLLEARGPQAQIVLSQQVGLDRTAVMRTVDLLESRGLVRRDPDAKDRRKNSVALTDAGATLLQQTLSAVRQAEREVTARLSDQEQGQLLRLLHRLLGLNVPVTSTER